MVKKTVKPLKGKDVAIMAQDHSGWHMAFQVRGGIDKLLIDMYRRPQLAESFIRRVADICIGMIKLMMDCGVEVLFITDDYADCHSPFMSPEFFRRFELPNIKRVIDLAEKKGIPILKHSDGNIYPILDYMVEAGIGGIHRSNLERWICKT